MKNIYFCSRTSHEVRGLTLNHQDIQDVVNVSHLTRGAWIEMLLGLRGIRLAKSHLTRGAWIEIPMTCASAAHGNVAPHTRCVD